MSFFSASAASPTTTFKPQIRQEGFHLPSPPPSVPSPSLADPMFSHFLPDPFRKQDPASHSTHLDFSDELASLIPTGPSPAPHSQATSHERSTHSPDDPTHDSSSSHYRHNIFDISAPNTATAFNTNHHHHHHHHHHQQQQQQQQQQPQHPTHHSHHSFSGPPPSSSYDYAQHASSPTGANVPPPHFNSTLPALGSSLRYDDGAAAAAAVAAATMATAVHAPPPTPSSYSAHIDYTRDPSTGPARSRSRSRDMTGPARTHRPKRGSISSASPPRHPHAILIPPGHTRSNTNPVSPLSLHSLSGSTPNGWFPTATGPGGHDYASLPTPDSLNGPAFGSYPAGALSVSPKDGADPSVGLDAAAKQAAIANEKRRRRRESHNAVERRRRDNINEKIAELATLIPESMLDAGATPTSPSDADIASPLAGLVPGSSETQHGSPKDDSAEHDSSGGGGGGSLSLKKDPASEKEKDRDGGVKANKGMILRKSVEYIRYLQQLVTAQAARNRELEAQLARTGGFVGPGSDVDGGGAVSAAGLASMAEPEMVLHDDQDDDSRFSLFGDHGRRSLERVLEQHEDEMDIEGAAGSVMDGASIAGMGGAPMPSQQQLPQGPGVDHDHDQGSTGDSASPIDLGERGRARTRVKEEHDDADDDMEMS